MTTKDKHRKLQKLLALAASANNNEAEAAMQKAQNLMQLWGIRFIDYNEEDDSVAINVITVSGYGSNQTAWEKRLAAVIAHCFDSVALFRNTSATKWQVVFVASESESKIVSDLYIKLRRIISKMAKLYSKNKPENALSLRKSYTLGLISTIKSRLLTIYKTTEDNKALVLCKKEHIWNTIDEMFGVVEKDKLTTPTHKQAYIDGIKDGNTISLSKSVKQNEQHDIDMH